MLVLTLLTAWRITTVWRMAFITTFYTDLLYFALLEWRTCKCCHKESRRTQRPSGNAYLIWTEYILLAWANYQSISGSVHTTPVKFKNWCSVGPPSVLICHENGAFRERPWTGGISKRWLFVFVWIENILKMEPFVNDDLTIFLWFPFKSFFLDANPKWLMVIVAPPV